MAKISSAVRYVLVACAFALALPVGSSSWAADTVDTYDGGGTPYAAQGAPTLTAGGPTGNFMRLASTAGVTGYVTYDRTSTPASNIVVLDFDFRTMNNGGGGHADGMGVALLNTVNYGTIGGVNWGTAEEPNVTNSLGVGFDIYNNGGTDPDNNHISLHFNGALLANQPLSGFGYNLWKGTGQPNNTPFDHARIAVNMAAGTVTVAITPAGGTPFVVFNNYAVPGLAAYECRVGFGGRTGGETADQDIDNVNAVFAGSGTITWNGSTSSAWGTPANWDAGRAPIPGDNVILTGAGAFRPTNQNVGGLSINTLTINNSAGAPFTVAGAPITLTSSGTALTVDTGSTDHTFSTDVVMGASQTWDIGAGRVITVSGFISGTANLTKSGTGVLALSGINTYSGNTAINAGSIRVVPPTATLVAGSSLWLDAADGATVIGNPVTQWNDKSGNNRNATTAGGAPPTYVSNPLAAGGNVIRFNGGNNYMNVDLSFLGNSQYTIFAVEGRTSGNTIFYLGTLPGGSANNGLHVGYRNNTAYTLAQWANDLDAGVPGYTSQVFRVWANQLSGTGHYIFQNGALLASNGNTQPLNPTGQGQVGASYDAGGNLYQGDLAEIVIYNTALTSAQRRQNETYFQYKWYGALPVLPSTTNVTVAANATLDLNGSKQTVGSLAGAANSNVALGGGTLTTGSAGSTTFAGVIAGAGGVTKVGDATTFTLTGTNVYAGTTTINGGTLQVGDGVTTGSLGAGDTVNNSALLFNNPGALTYNGVISGAGSLTKNAAGVLTLGAQSSYTGATLVNQGTLRLQAPAAPVPVGGTEFWLDAANAGSISLASGNVTQWNDASGNPLFVSQGNTAQQGRYSLGQLNGRPIVDFGAPGSNLWMQFSAGLGDIRSVFWVMKGSSFMLGNTGAYEFHRGAPNYGAGATDNIWDNGNTSGNIRGGKTYLNGAQVDGVNTPLPADYSRISLITSGNVAANALANDRNIGGRVGGQQIAEILIYNTALTDAQRQQNDAYLRYKWFGESVLPYTTAVTVAAAGALDVNGINQTIGSLAGPAGGSVALGAGTLTVGANNASTDFAGAVSGTGGLAKTGTGTLTLSGTTSSYGGPTTINQGLLRVSGGNAIPDSSTVVLADTAGATLDLNGSNETIAGLSGGGLNGGNVTLGIGTLSVGSAASSTYSGCISGAGSITKVGAGTQTLAGNNTYTGVTRVNVGVLKVAGAPAAGPALWLDAVAATTLTKDASGRVSAWSDKAGGAGLVAQGNVSYQPALVANALNGLPVVHFAGASRNFLNNNTNYPAPATVVCVGRLTGGDNERLFASNGNNWLMGFHGGNRNQAYFEGWVSGAGGWAADTNAYVFTGVIPGGGQYSSLFTNGVWVRSGPAGVTGPNGFELGGWNGAQENSNGDVAEVLIYNRVLTDAERQATESYLLTKWFRNVIPDGSQIIVASGATLDLSGVREVVGSLAGSGSVSLAGGGTLVTGGDNLSTAFSGGISGTDGNLTKQGSGTFTLTAGSTYSGTTTVSAGTLQLSGAAAGIDASLALDLGAGGTLDIDSTVGVTSRINDAASITFNGGTLSLTAPLNVTRAETVGALIFNSGASTIVMNPSSTTAGQGDVQVTSASFTRNGTATFDFARNISAAEIANLYTGGIPNGTMVPYATVNGLPAAYDTSAPDGGLIDAASSSSTRITVADGAWSAPATWQGGVVPGPADSVLVRHAVTLDVAPTIQLLSFDTGNPSIAPGVASTLTITSGTIGVAGAVSPSMSCDVVLGADGRIAQNSAGTLTISGVISAPQLVSPMAARYTFDEAAGVTAFDSSGNGRNATLVNAMSRIPGQVGTGAVQFPGGGDDYVLAPPFQLGGGATSFVAWVNCANPGANWVRVFDFGSGAANNNLLLAFQGGTGGKMTLHDYYGGSNQGEARTAATFPVSTWVHVAAVIDATGNATIYWNGVAQPLETGSFVGLPPSVIRANQYIGKSNWGFGDAMFAGMMDEFRIYGRGLSSAEVSQLFAGSELYTQPGLTKSGTGTLALSGANTYAGPTTVTAGVLRVANTSALGTASNGTTVANGAALELAGVSLPGEALTLAGTGVSNGGVLRSLGGGNTLSGAVTLTGAARINADAGTLTLNSATAISGAGQALTVGGAGNVAIDSAIATGAGSLTKDGAGTLTLSAANTYTGGTTVSAGTLQGTTISLQGNIVNNGAVVFDQNTDGGYSGFISGTGSVTKNGTGTVTFSGTNTYAGATNINVGTLRASAHIGLLEGRVNGNFNTTDPNPGTSVQLTTRYANIHDNGPTYPATQGAWADNTTFIYSGFINNPTAANVTYTFAENFDDSVRLTIDGVQVLNDGNWGAATYANYVLTPGLHSFDLRLGQGGGGVGYSQSGDWLTRGFAYDPLGLNTNVDGNYILMVDPGDGSLFKNSATSAALPDLSAVVVAGGAVLDLNGYNETIGSLAGAGNVTMGAATLASGGNNTSTTFTGALLGTTGGLVKQGTGTFIVGNTNTYAGATTVSAGTLRLSGAAASIDSSVALSIGAGATLDIDATVGVTSRINDAAPITFDSGTLSISTPLNTSRYEIVGDLIFNSGANTIALTPNSTLPGQGDVELETLTFTRNSGATLNFARGTSGSVRSNLWTGNLPDGLSVSYATVNGLASIYSGNPDCGLIASGTVFSVANGNWESGTTWSTGTVPIDIDNVIVRHNVVVNDYREVNTLGFDSVGSATPSISANPGGELYLYGDTIGVTGSASPTIGCNISCWGSFISHNGTGTLTISGVLSIFTTLTKTGPGTVVLSAANNYSGVTTIVAGTLRITDATGLGTDVGGTVVQDGATLEVSGGIAVGAEALTLTGSGVGGNGALRNLSGNNSIGGDVTMNGAQVAAEAATTLTMSGVFSGTGRLTKGGDGALVLTGANTYTGGTTVSAGTLQGTTTSLQGDIVDNAAVVFDQNTNGVYYRSISGTGSVTKSGTGTVIFGGTNTYAGATNINGGTLRVSGYAGLFEGRVNGAFNTTDANPATSTQFTTRYANIADNGPAYPVTLGAWADNTTFIYSGFINNPTAANVTYTFAENFDDSVRLTIDGNQVLNDGTWNNPTLASYTLTPGLHGFDLRLGEGGGGVGLTNQGWFNNNIGFGYDPLGRNQPVAGNYIPMVEPGDGSLFKTSLSTIGAALPDLSAVVIAPGAILDLNGYTETIGSLAGAGSVTMGSATLTTGGNNGTTAYAGVISGTGALVKQGAGAMTLSAANTYSGTTSVAAGALLVNGSVGNGAVNVSQGATLGGTGTVAADTTINGVLSPGDGGAGTLTITGTTVLTASGAFLVDLNGLVAGTSYDQLSASGTLDLGSATLTGVVGFVPPNGSTFTIISKSSPGPVTGIFAGLPEGALVTVGGRPFTVSYAGGDGNDVVLTCTFQTFTWNGGGGDNKWTTAPNWVGGVAPTAGQNLVFADSSLRANPLNNFPANTPFGSIVFTGAGFTVGGNPISFNGGGTVLNNNVAGANTINTNIAIAGVPGTIAALAGGSLAIGGTVDNGGMLLTVDSAGSTAFNSIISGTGGLMKLSTGTLTLSGANTYSGGTTVSAGILQGTTTSLQGDIVDNGTVLFNQAGAGTYAGVISGTGALTLDGGGAVTLSSTNTYAGATTITSGTLTINGLPNTASVSVATAGTLAGVGAIGGNLTVDGTVSPGAGGIGTLTVAGSATFNPNSAFTVELDGSVPVSDRLAANGVTIGANVTLNASLLVASSHLQQFTLVSNAGATVGTFNGLANGALTTIGTRDYIIHYDGGTGNDVVLTDDRAPVAVADAYSTDEDTALNVPAPGVLVNDSDPDGDAITAALVTGPVSAAAFTLNADGSFSYTPVLNFNGADSFTYRANDGLANSNTVTVNLTVNAVNDPPTFTLTGPGVTVLESDVMQAQTIGTWAQNMSPGPPDEAGQTPLIFNVINDNNAMFAVQPAINAVTGDLTFTQVPYANGSATVTVTLQDSGSGVPPNVNTSASQQFTITFTPVNFPPVAVDDPVVPGTYWVVVTRTLTVPAAQGVLINDSDPDGDAITAVVDTLPASGTLTLNADGSFTYIAPATAGVVTFTYRALDSGVVPPQMQSNVATVTINVLANTPPVATDDAYSTNEDTALNVPAPGVLANDTDADSDPFTAVLVAGPTHGALTLNADGSFAYMPALDYNGLDSFTYRANDGLDVSNVATVTLTINPVNDVPVAAPQLVTTPEDTAVAITLTGDDGDPMPFEVQVLTFEIVTPPAHGALSLFDAAAGTVTYTPALNYNGPDSFTFRITDDNTAGGAALTSLPATVTITVTPVNDIPTALAQAVITAEDTPLTITLRGDDGDPMPFEVQALTAGIVTQPAHGTLSNLDPAAGTVTYTPELNYFGPDSFTFSITDDNTAGGAALTSLPATVTITVTPVNDAPVALPQTLNVGINRPLAIVVTAVDVPNEGQTLTYAIVTGPANGTLSTLSPQTGAVTYMPKNGFFGVDTFTFTATDDGNPNLTSAPATITINVRPPPVFESQPVMTPEPVVVGEPVLCQAGAGDASIVWNFGDGSQAAGNDVVHIYTQAGIYTVTVTATSPEGVPSVYQMQVFVSLGLAGASATGTGGAAMPPGASGIIIGGVGVGPEAGGSGKILCNYVRRGKSYIMGSVGNIAFPATLLQSQLMGQPGVLTLGKGDVAQTFIFTLSKSGKGKATSLPIIEVNLKKQRIRFKASNRPGLTALIETLGGTWVQGVKKGPVFVMNVPATLQVDNLVFLAMTFQMEYRQIGDTGKGGLAP